MLLDLKISVMVGGFDGLCRVLFQLTTFGRIKQDVVVIEEDRVRSPDVEIGFII